MLKKIRVRLVEGPEESRFQELMQTHHYLGSLRKIGETLWYVATHGEEWGALLIFSAAALKLAARDQWIGWSYRQQYARLRLLANNTRYCVLPTWHLPNVASRVLAQCEQRISGDWMAAFGHPIVLLETFVDNKHRGTLYRAANWTHVGETRGFRRIPGGYSNTAHEPKKIFVREILPQARERLRRAEFAAEEEGKKRMLKVEHLGALPEVFRDVSDPRRVAGRCHPLPVVLAIVAGAYLCGARGHKAMGAWAEQLTQSARARLRCRCERNHYRVPSASLIRDVLGRVDRQELQRALESWNARYAVEDASLRLTCRVLSYETSRNESTV